MIWIPLSCIYERLVGMLEQHKKAWLHCSKCPLHKTRSRTCLYRGIEPPCDVLFLGDAPGPSDDSLGRPFSGPAGDTLDLITKQAGLEPLIAGYSNLLACHPTNEKGQQREPKKSELMRCFPRVIELIKLCRPSLIVTVGITPTKILGSWAEGLKIDDWEPMRLEMTHPNIIYRTGGKDSVAFPYAVVALRTHIQFLKQCKGW